MITAFLLIDTPLAVLAVSVDADLRVWLCEINASPAVADVLLPSFCAALVRECVDPICAPNAALFDAPAYAAAATDAHEKGECFELLYKNEKAE